MDSDARRRNGHMGPRTGIAFGLAVCLVASCSSGGSKAAPSHAPRHVAPPTVPAAPVALATPVGNPAARARALAAAVAHPGDASIPAWLRAYDLAGVPVFDTNGRPLGTTGADPAGVHYWQVWMAATLNQAGTGVSLSDLGRIIADRGAPRAGTAGTVLLTALRAAPKSADAHAAFAADFVAARVAQSPAHVDLMDARVNADSVVLDSATAQLLSYVAFRSLLARAFGTAHTAAATHTSTPLIQTLAFHEAGTSGGLPCNQIWGSEDATQWINWFTNKAAGGAGILGVGDLPGISNVIAGLTPSIDAATAAEKAQATKSVLNKVNLITSLLTLIMQLATVTIDASSDPPMLERTKSSGSDGQLAHDTFQLRFDLGDLPDGNNKLLCGLSFLANTAGISFSLPADGPISKAEVTVTGGAGFANGLSSDDQLVLFADYTQLKQETGSDGGFRVDVLGKRQKHDLPDSARPVSKEYSLSISAQLAEVNAGNIASIFLDGLTVSDGVGVGSAVLDVAQTLHLASDDPVYPLTDWVAGYTVDQTTYGYHLSGTICDPAKPYHLQANGNLGGAHAAGTITVVPSGSGGTWTYDGSFGNPNAVPQHGTGRLKSEFPDKSEPDVTLLTGDWYVVVPIAGTTPLGPSGHHLPDLHLDLHPIEGECPQNS